jgi:hypothetical protein
VRCGRSDLEEPVAWNDKRVMLTLSWLFSLATANFVGGAVGFSQGTRTQLALSASGATETVAALRLLRAGDTAGAIRFLEMNLDAQIAANVFGSHAYHSPYNVFMRFVFGEHPVEGNAWSLLMVLKYREEYPPVIGDEPGKAKLMEGLARYRNARNPELSAPPGR